MPPRPILAPCFRLLLLFALFVLFALPVAAPAFASPTFAGDVCPLPDSVRVDSIVFEGLRTTRGFVVRRELRHRPGVPFSCEDWRIEKARLEDLDIFAEIRLRAEPAGDSAGSGPVRLVYVFKELPAYVPFVAVSKTEQDGLSAGPAIASLNLLGRDIRLEIITRFGGTSEMLAAISSPWIGPLPWEYDLALIHIDSYNAFEDFHEDSWRGKLDLQRRIRGPLQLLLNGEMFWIRDGEAVPGAPTPTLSPGWDFVPRLGGGLLWDARDRRRNPGRGVYQEVRYTRNGGLLGGDAEYGEWLSDSRAYLPWLGRNVLFLGVLYQYRNGRLGESFPFYDRFHAGGINTLRGFKTDALAGKSEWIANLENRYDLIRMRTVKVGPWDFYYGLQGIIGFEAASLWDHDALLEEKAHAGVYLGMHLLVAGIDRIRIELGSNTAKFEFRTDIGILEKSDAQRFRAR
ncbi:MAG TPA: BamA/TamA family outer membrane protein [Fibrobacteria bacterium]|nr:BamA/TamA family outer membrane protein [Fibrobacteria bacterium]